MPANEIVINGTMKFIIVDSKMDELLKWLRENGIANRRKTRT